MVIAAQQGVFSEAAFRALPLERPQHLPQHLLAYCITSHHIPFSHSYSRQMIVQVLWTIAMANVVTVTCTKP